MSSHSFPCGSYKTTVRKVTVCSGLFNTLRLTSCSGKRVCDCFTKGSVACCLTLSLDVHVLHGVLQSCMLYLSKLHLSKLHLSKANLPRHAQHVYKMRMWTALGNVFALKAHVCTCGCSRWMSLWQLCWGDGPRQCCSLRTSTSSMPAPSWRGTETTTLFSMMTSRSISSSN